MFVITGATGHVGSAAAATLLDQGKPVRVVIRNAAKAEPWKERGAQVAIADLGDSAALREAFEGAEGVFAMIPPAYGAADYRADRRVVSLALEEACRETSVPQVVLLSSVGAQLASGTGPVGSLHDAELIFRDYPGGLTVLRPCSFMENLESLLPQAQADGVMPSFLTVDHKVPMISTLDIGRTAAECLVTPTGKRKVIEMAGPEDYSPEDAAAALSELLGKAVSAQPAPLEAVVPTFLSFGFTQNAAELMAELYNAINTETIPFEGGSAEFRRGMVDLREGLRHMLNAGKKST